MDGNAPKNAKMMVYKKRLIDHHTCIAPLKKISPENPYGIRGFGIFYAFLEILAQFNHKQRIFLSAKKDITLF